jgi:SAM-dependent methyltransferase
MKGLMRQDLYRELYTVENRHWWHQHKRALVRSWLKKYRSKPGRIIDIGVGTGRILSELKWRGWDVFGIDGEAEAIKFSKKRGVTAKRVNLANFPWPLSANQFHAALILDTLEHLKDDLKALQEIKRLVKPGGLIIITVPAYQRLFSYWDKMLGHVRRYQHNDLITLSRLADLKLVRVSYCFSFLLMPAIIIRRFKKLFRLDQQSDFLDTPGYTLMLPILKLFSFLERMWLKHFNVPVGLSLICVLEKK